MAVGLRRPDEPEPGTTDDQEGHAGRQRHAGRRRTAERDDLARVHLGRGCVVDGRAPRRRRAQHRPRSRRPPCALRPRRPRRAPVPAPGRLGAGRHLRGARRPDRPVRRSPLPARRRAGRARLPPCWPGPRAVRRGTRHVAPRGRAVPPVRSVRAGAAAPAPRTGRRCGPGDHRRAVPAQGRGPARPTARVAPCAAHRRRGARRPRRRRPRPDGAARRCGTGGTDRTDRPDEMALLHFTSGTTGMPKGAVHVHEAVVAHHATARFVLDLAPRRRVLVHCGSGMGHRDLLRHHRAPDPWRDRHRGRGRVRRTPLVLDVARPARERLVHGAHGHPDAHAGGRRPARRVRPELPAPHRLGGRTAQPRGRALGAAGAGPSDPRQLVAERDRRDHDRERPRGRGAARVDGTPGARGSRRRWSAWTPGTARSSGPTAHPS